MFRTAQQLLYTTTGAVSVRSASPHPTKLTSVTSSPAVGDPTDPDKANPWGDEYKAGSTIRSALAQRDYEYAIAHGLWDGTINRPEKPTPIPAITPSPTPTVEPGLTPEPSGSRAVDFARTAGFTNPDCNAQTDSVGRNTPSFDQSLSGLLARRAFRMRYRLTQTTTKKRSRKAVSFLLYGICRLLPLQTYSFGGIIAL